jgi:hypothetical protein
VARHRTVVLALLTTFASAILGLALTNQLDGFWGLFLGALAVGLIVFAGAVPHRFEAAERVATLLPVIHTVLGLSPTDRIALHHLKGFPSKRYEQITDYYPRQANPTRGRTWRLSHGIVAQAFNTVQPVHWAVPKGKEFLKAMQDRWSFNREEVAKLTPDRRSFLAFPILEESPYAKAVLYLDSPSADTFNGLRAEKTIERIREVFLDHLAEILRPS